MEGSGMKESEGDRLKSTIYESTLSTVDAVPLPRVGKGASGASRIGFWRYEKDRGQSSQVRRLREHPIHRCAVPLPQWGRQRGGGFAAKKEANPASLRSAAPSKGRGSRGYSLLPMEEGAPKGRRLDGGKRYEREGEIISGRRFTKAPSARKQLIKPIYSYKKRKSNAANDFNVIDRSGHRYMQEKSEAVHFYD